MKEVLSLLVDGVRMEKRHAWFSCFLILLLGAGSVSCADSSPESLVEGGHLKRLRSWAEPRVAANPNDAQAVYFLALAKEEIGDLGGALPLAERALSLDPNNAQFHLLVANIYIQQGQKAGTFKGLGLAHRFRDEAQKAVSLDPKLIDARESLMEFYYQAPGIAGGDKKKAWATADEIGKIDVVRGLLAQANLARWERDAAKQASLYEAALAVAPDDARVLSQAAVFYAADSQKKYDLAEKYALKAMKLSPDHSGPYATLAIVYANAASWKELDAVLGESEHNIPDDLGAYYQAGKALLIGGKDLPRAELYLRKYLTIEPEAGEPHHAAAHWRLGQVLEKEGKKAEAIAEMNQSLRWSRTSSRRRMT